MTFRELHESGCFVLPNAWDAGSAILLGRLGFPAVASTSAGFAFSLGRPDDADAVPLELLLDHLRALVATGLPVNADFQNGYAASPEGVAENVTRCVATGVAGLSIEDNAGSSLYDLDLAVERVRAARAAIDATGAPVVFTARCEAHLVGDPSASRTVLERLVAFAEAGADCLYAPGLRTTDEIASVVRAVAPLPVNVLVTENGPVRSVAALADLGVRRSRWGPGWPGSPGARSSGRRGPSPRKARSPTWPAPPPSHTSTPSSAPDPLCLQESFQALCGLKPACRRRSQARVGNSLQASAGVKLSAFRAARAGWGGGRG
jgi:2-methylisocitrate lyase-like PEP mutase family enzyme